ncbi:hypothetical protein [Burkholderia stabilis]|nr:hypothetical protein [Burkholderia stabilis]
MRKPRRVPAAIRNFATSRVRAFAAGTLPMPNAHLAAVRRLAQALATAH